eukprot:CAMPEP_0174262166 /NCGR_PEP_ID=MMETSP0439-20130205/12809_1 /TAXON_ID=0 /ORGANISM="Stereomyxa ramosa, Strain Chinc5" /LENGTH=1000 /DNA_ID=CAMNT_0015346821 /DNA_START=24 /DNA_END=3026 /DNA_ORIENTATION=-
MKVALALFLGILALGAVEAGKPRHCGTGRKLCTAQKWKGTYTFCKPPRTPINLRVSERFDATELIEGKVDHDALRDLYRLVDNKLAYLRDTASLLDNDSSWETLVCPGVEVEGACCAESACGRTRCVTTDGVENCFCDFSEECTSCCARELSRSIHLTGKELGWKWIEDMKEFMKESHELLKKMPHSIRKVLSIMDPYYFEEFTDPLTAEVNIFEMQDYIKDSFFDDLEFFVTSLFVDVGGDAACVGNQEEQIAEALSGVEKRGETEPISTTIVYDHEDISLPTQEVECGDSVTHTAEYVLGPDDVVIISYDGACQLKRHNAETVGITADELIACGNEVLEIEEDFTWDYTYPTAGEYTTRVFVCHYNTTGNTTRPCDGITFFEATTRVTVTPEIEETNIFPERTTLTEGTAITLEMIAADSCLAADFADIVYSVNWGDGSSDPAIPATFTSQVHNPKWEATTTHVYGNEGTYFVSITATNAFGLTHTKTIVVQIFDRAPVILNSTVSNEAVFEGDEISTSGVFHSYGSLDAHKLNIYWGEPASQVLSVDETLVGPPGVEGGVDGTWYATHTFSRFNKHGLKIRIIDDDNLMDIVEEEVHAIYRFLSFAIATAGDIHIGSNSVLNTIGYTYKDLDVVPGIMSVGRTYIENTVINADLYSYGSESSGITLDTTTAQDIYTKDLELIGVTTSGAIYENFEEKKMSLIKDFRMNKYMKPSISEVPREKLSEMKRFLSEQKEEPEESRSVSCEGDDKRLLTDCIPTIIVDDPEKNYGKIYAHTMEIRCGFQADRLVVKNEIIFNIDPDCEEVVIRLDGDVYIPQTTTVTNATEPTNILWLINGEQTFSWNSPQFYGTILGFESACQFGDDVTVNGALYCDSVTTGEDFTLNGEISVDLILDLFLCLLPEEPYCGDRRCDKGEICDFDHCEDNSCLRDVDGDGVNDCEDECPENPDLIKEGICHCMSCDDHYLTLKTTFRSMEREKKSYFDHLVETLHINLDLPC